MTPRTEVEQMEGHHLLEGISAIPADLERRIGGRWLGCVHPWDAHRGSLANCPPRVCRLDRGVHALQGNLPPGDYGSPPGPVFSGFSSMLCAGQRGNRFCAQCVDLPESVDESSPPNPDG